MTYVHGLAQKSHEMLEERVAHLTELQISNDSLEAGNEQLSAEVQVDNHNVTKLIMAMQ